MTNADEMLSKDTKSNGMLQTQFGLCPIMAIGCFEKIDDPSKLMNNQNNDQLSISDSGVDLIKLFWRKFTYTFFKLDNFILMQHSLIMFVKGLAYKKP